MISVLLYGRNDNYGYNLHKRAALSFNCIAEVLADPTDEIIFVDYNTPDDFPTFPEAIQDTLTAKARQLLRILRVRPRHHQKFLTQTHLSALEPIARNVGLRRSNPDNRWILSTNTDMIFVSRNGRPLSDVAEHLGDGYYHLPRFELPETLWETLDRLDAAGTIRQVADWGWKFHLNEVVEAQEPAIRYDGPGDFQLVLRSDLFRIHGFDERMLLGWHVDSNIARRLNLIYWAVGDILDQYFGYHCDHTRQATPAHRPGGVQNSTGTFIDGITTPFAPAQELTWGLAGETIEEFRLESGSSAYLRGLRAAISQAQEVPSRVHYGAKTHDRIDYVTPHVVPFLVDALASYPRSTKIGWFSTRPDLLQAFAAAWVAMGGSQTILVDNTDPWPESAVPSACVAASPTEIGQRADVFVFDWGLPATAGAEGWEFERDPALRKVADRFRAMVRFEWERSAQPSELPRRFIGVNAINNRCEVLFQSYIGATRSPLSCRLRQGFLIQDLRHWEAPRELIKQLSVGMAGTREPEGISAAKGMRGHVCYGPYIDLLPGWYRLTAKLIVKSWRGLNSFRLRGAVLEVASGSDLFSCYEITPDDLRQGEISFPFLVPASVERLVWELEFRLFSPGRAHMVLTSLTVAAKAEMHAGQSEQRPIKHFDKPPFRRTIAAFVHSSRRIIKPIVRWSRGRERMAASILQRRDTE